MNKFIKETALSIGFDACGIAKADYLKEDAEFLKTWLNEGKHGDMHYLERNFEKRTNPKELVPGCKSVIVVLLNYYPEKKQNTNAPKIAKYAYSSIDYHFVIKAKLNELELQLKAKYGENCMSNEYQHSFVDSAPVLERRWAEKAGLGWIGKHTQLINPTLGSYTFIGVLMFNLEPEYDKQITPHCGTCTKCVDICPTKALTPRTIDARKCISYQTIENKHKIPIDLQKQLSGNIIGCDICADVCPWNKKLAMPHSHNELEPNNYIIESEENTWIDLTHEKFNSTFKHSAIKRAGFNKLNQNLSIYFDNKTNTKD